MEINVNDTVRNFILLAMLLVLFAQCQVQDRARDALRDINRTLIAHAEIQARMLANCGKD